MIHRENPTAAIDQLVDAWLSEGAQLVGGCCRIGRADISRIAALVRVRA